ncbi:MAG: ATP-dependent RNA helicase HrpA [Pseudomonadota bacterium]|nr:ATP-dependent RNA helicase HrpA [Pseudomonadota bacterium]
MTPPNLRDQHHHQALLESIFKCRTSDVGKLLKRWRGLKRRLAAGESADRGLAALSRDIQQSLARCEIRAGRLPTLEYPPALPVSERRDEIIEAIRSHQVLIVCGETGSGKTTQLPKLCLAAGQGIRGLIGHTQPRRLAARTVATRIAEELGTPLGEEAGFKVRFSQSLGPDPFVKVMTDGILLAETQQDRMLSAYDTLIVDEAHERSLNIDFLLGYLRQLLPRRRDLKLIVTSATIDPERFSRHFGNAPILEVSGRTYPVDIRYRPLDDTPDRSRRDITQGIVDAVQELDRAGRGDMLVFLPGERDIRETADALRKRALPQTEILPLYSRLAARDQNLVFRSHTQRRIVLATNVAETSITVPGIRYVIDPGLARISRYSYRTKVQRLPIEPVSQASANQRAGRCGRTGPGICLRLYSEEDFHSRSEFTEPEILRTNLASVILQMKSLGLGDIDQFPFIEPPDSRYVNDGLRMLAEIGALDEGRNLTRPGRELARLPVDPGLGRMVLAGAEHHCLHEILIIVSGLSIQDPRERPADYAQQADEAQRPFQDERSDFLSYLNLWNAYRDAAALSGSRLRAFCEAHFLSYLRMREWQDVHRELLATVNESGFRINQTPADYAAIHKALLTGLLSRIGFKGEDGEYQGPRGTRFHVHPGSALFKKRPPWLMAAELVETARLYARCVARVEPEWIEEIGSHLLKRSYFDPHWEKRPAQAVAYEQTSLYGLVLTARRRVHYGPIEPVASREIFIREGLCAGGYVSQGVFQARNRTLIESLENEEAKFRQEGVLFDPETIFDFYDQRIPEDIYSGKTFETWRKKNEAKTPALLVMTKADLLRGDVQLASAVAFPDFISVQGLQLPLAYRLEPGTDADGVTVRIPLPALNQLNPAPFEWLVPGLLEERIVALIRSLPKPLRRNCVPAPHFARAVREALSYDPEKDLLGAIAGELNRMTGVEIPRDAWDPSKVPRHLKMRFELVDEQGHVQAEGRDLSALQREHGGRARQTFGATVESPWERCDLKEWDFGELPESVEITRAGVQLRAYPALDVAEDGCVNLRLMDSPEAAAQATRHGVIGLIRLKLHQQIRYLEKNIPALQTMCLHFSAQGDCAGLRDDIIYAAMDTVFLGDGVPRTEAAFRDCLTQGRAQLTPAVNDIAGHVAPTLATYHQVLKALKRGASPALVGAYQDVRDQIDRLIYPGFVRATPAPWRARLQVYLEAASRRLERMPQRLERDRQAQSQVRQWWLWYENKGGDRAAQTREALREFRWLIEEYRVSLFAQDLGTVRPVSEKRLQKLADALK